MIYEGTPDFPDKERWWAIAERYGVTILYTAPTAIRAHMKWGPEHAAAHDLSTLRLLGSVGEPINPEAWVWYHEHIGGGRCPIVDTWWQTETGMAMITPLPGVTTREARLGDEAVPGRRRSGLRRGRERGRPGRRRLSRAAAALAGDDARHLRRPRALPGHVLVALPRASTSPGDGARIDEDGDFWLLGRVDDVMNVSGHRISTIEVESALVDHPAVAEAAVCGRADALTGPGDRRLRDAEGRPGGLGRDARGAPQPRGRGDRPDRQAGEHPLHPELPKTRSGKIMRRLLRDVAENRPLGDTTTLADPTVVEEIRERSVSAPAEE